MDEGWRHFFFCFSFCLFVCLFICLLTTSLNILYHLLNLHISTIDISTATVVSRTPGRVDVEKGVVGMFTSFANPNFVIIFNSPPPSFSPISYSIPVILATGLTNHAIWNALVWLDSYHDCHHSHRPDQSCDLERSCVAWFLSWLPPLREPSNRVLFCMGLL